MGLLGGLVASLTVPRLAHATTARAVSLQDLVQRSSRVVQSTPLESFARSESFAGAQHIVTYSRLRVDARLHGDTPETEILVRTLGGTLGSVAELVHGEAELALNESCVVFLRKDSQGIESVTAMAQGHYPLTLDSSGVSRLSASRNMPHLLHSAGALAAVQQLDGLAIAEARSLIAGASH